MTLFPSRPVDRLSMRLGRLEDAHRPPEPPDPPAVWLDLLTDAETLELDDRLMADCDCPDTWPDYCVHVQAALEWAYDLAEHHPC